MTIMPAARVRPMSVLASMSRVRHVVPGGRSPMLRGCLLGRLPLVSNRTQPTTDHDAYAYALPTTRQVSAADHHMLQGQ